MNFLSNDPRGTKLNALLPLTSVLVILLLTGSCSDTTFVPPPTRTPLSSSISSAIQLVLTTPEGAAAGQNIRGSQLTLKQAITVAQTIYATQASTQADIDKANADLAAAVAVFKSQKVAGVDLPNLAGHWTLDEISDSGEDAVVKDYSGNKRDGAVKIGHVFWGRGTPTLGTDRYNVWGKCLHFTQGANIEVPYDADFNKPTISISLWFRAEINDPIVAGQYAVSLGRFTGYNVQFDGGPATVFAFNSSESPGTTVSLSSETVLSQNTWRHLVVTYGNGHAMFYVNGALVKDVASNKTIVTQSSVNLVFAQDLPTGKYSSDGSSPFYVNTGGYFAGYLDEIRIYKSVLTPEQVAAIYTIEKP